MVGNRNKLSRESLAGEAHEQVCPPMKYYTRRAFNSVV